MPSISSIGPHSCNAPHTPAECIKHYFIRPSVYFQFIYYTITFKKLKSENQISAMHENAYGAHSAFVVFVASSVFRISAETFKELNDIENIGEHVLQYIYVCGSMSIRDDICQCHFEFWPIKNLLFDSSNFAPKIMFEYCTPFVSIPVCKLHIFIRKYAPSAVSKCHTRSIQRNFSNVNKFGNAIHVTPFHLLPFLVFYLLHFHLLIFSLASRQSVYM